jgi:hypothetical protein
VTVAIPQVTNAVEYYSLNALNNSRKIASIEGNSDDALVERKMCELFIETANLKEAVDGKNASACFRIHNQS